MEERKMILKMIEDGKITADEGLKLLEALQKDDNKDEPKAEVEEEKATESTDTQVSKVVDWEKGNDYKKTYKQPSGTTKFTDFIESAIQKIKEFDLDFNFGSHIEVDHIFQHQNFSQAHIDVSLENGSLNVVPWSSPDVRIECKAKVYRVKDVEEARQVFLRETTFEPGEEKLRFATKVKSIKVNAVMYIPEQQYQNIKLYTFNGQIDGEKITSEAFDVKTVNGSISIERAEVTKMYAETVHGPISLTGSRVERCEAKTMNGAVDLEGKMINTDVETVNGTITYELTNTDKPCYLDVKATTGSIRLTLPDNLKTEGKLKTNVGGFSCELPNLEVIEEKKEFAQKIMSFVSNKEAETKMTITADTKTGSISLRTQ
ncbi:DUF4097 domain-containing protein [Desertibacillus haloalkaliphilus]|nr:DUF4097 domain-containing protein [Desertibacillus haloalkaliphilus]